MCGLMFIQDKELWPEAITANLARAGRNKGAFTITPVTPPPAEFSIGATQIHEVAKLNPFAEFGVAIAHLQAPTSAASRPHPVVVTSRHLQTMLWHNGFLKEKTITRLAALYPECSLWDTELLAQHMIRTATRGLADVEGSFACIVAVRGMGMMAFRNNLAPLFTDGRNLSSVPIYGKWEPLDAGVIYTMGGDGRWVKTSTKFATYDDPFGIDL